MDIQAIDHEYVANTYARFPVTITHGKGSLVWDENGKEYIDLGTGIAVNTFGVSDDEWVKAVTEQLLKVQHTSNLYYTEPCALLAKEICERTDMKKVSSVTPVPKRMNALSKWRVNMRQKRRARIITRSSH